MKRSMIDLESQSQATLPKQFGNSQLRAMLAIASFIIHYSRPRDDRKKNTDTIEFCELGDVYQIVEHRLCRPREDEAVAEMDRRTAPVEIPACIRICKHWPTSRYLS